jgi:hypothetical protein
LKTKRIKLSLAKLNKEEAETEMAEEAKEEEKDKINKAIVKLY